MSRRALTKRWEREYTRKSGTNAQWTRITWCKYRIENRLTEFEQLFEIFFEILFALH
jgi:hypothetical protein